MCDNILLVGIGNDIYREYAVKEIYDEGFNIYLISHSFPEWARKYVKEFFPCNLSDIKSALSVVDDITSKIGIDGVITFIEPWVVVCAEISDRLNLRYINTETANLIRDKYELRKLLVEQGLSSVKFFDVDADFDPTDPKLKYPFILKPKSGYASLNVYKIESPTQFYKAMQLSKQADLNGFENPGDNFFVESYIDGKEYSVEGIVTTNNNVVIYSVTEKFLSCCDGFEEIGHITPALLTDDEMTKIHSFVKKIISVSGMQHCAFHIELKIDTHGIEVIEIGARPAGDLIPYLVHKSTGVAMNAELAKASIGDSVNVAPNDNIVFGIAFLVPSRPFLCSVDISDDLLKYNAIEVKLWLENKKEYLVPPDRFFERCGYIIDTAKSQDELKKKINETIKKISQEYNIPLQYLH